MAKRSPPICKRVYIDNDGEEFATMPADPSAIVVQEFRFLDEAKTTRRIDVKDFSDAIRHGAMFHGFNQALGDTFSGAAGIVADALADFDARYARLKSGAWRAGDGGGGRSDSILAEAMLAYFADEGKTETKDGVTIDAAWVRGFLLAEDVIDEADVKEARSKRAKAWKANEGVYAHYERIRAEREAKKVATVDAADTDDI